VSSTLRTIDPATKMMIAIYDFQDVYTDLYLGEFAKDMCLR
jgi:hypothetical protein